MPAAIIAQCVEQAGAHALTLGVATHADHLEAKPGREATKLTFQHAGKNVPGKSLFIDGRKLCVQLRLAQCGVEAPFEVGVARRPLDAGVDGDDGSKVFAHQRSNHDALQSNGFHGRLLLSVNNRRQAPA